jgi:hypothetical protein
MSWLTEYVNSGYIALIGALISAISGLLLGREQPRAKGLLTFMVCLGASVTAVGGYWASYEQDKANRVVFEQTNKIIELNEKLVIKSDEIAALNRAISGSITGGDSFCYVALSNLDSVTNTGILTVIQEGNYPLYDLSIRMADVEKFLQLQKVLPIGQVRLQVETHLNVGNVSLSHAYNLRIWKLPNLDQQSYNIFIMARNGSFTQLLRFRRVNGEWISATKVMRRNGKDSVVLLEEIDKSFPRDATGQVDWGK